MRHLVKLALLWCAGQIGGTACIGRSKWRSRRLLILAYHSVGVADEHAWNPAFSMTAAALENRLKIIKRENCTVLPLIEALELVRSGGLPERAVCLTFDDGLFDFKERAYPVISSFGYPVTVFLPTLYCRFNRPVFEPACAYILWKGRKRTLDLSAITGGDHGTLDLASHAAREYARKAVLNAAKPLTIQERDDLAARLAASAGVDYEEMCGRRILTLLNPAEVTALSRAGVDFQLHTHTHCMPPDREGLAREIERNRAEIRAMTGKTPVHLCYPEGVHGPQFRPWLRDLNVISASTCEAGLVSAGAEPLAIPRWIDSEMQGDYVFEAWLSGLASLLPHLGYKTSAGPRHAPPGSHDLG